MAKKEILQNTTSNHPKKPMVLKLLEFIADCIGLLIFVELSKPFWPFWSSLYNLVFFAICMVLMIVIAPLLQNKVDNLYYKIS